MRKLLLAAALLWVAPTNAAILTYDYQGQPLVCPDPAQCGGQTQPAWTGNLVIDEATMPSGSISGLTLSFFWHTWTANSSFSSEPLDYKRLSISNASGILANYSEEFSVIGGIAYFLSFDWSAWGVLEGFYGPQLFNPNDAGVASGHFSITFDAFGVPVAWSGANMFGASEVDPSTTNGIDRHGHYLRSAAPGTWTLTGTPSPAPVPVPPALLLFGSALGLTVFANRWRRRRVGR